LKLPYFSSRIIASRLGRPNPWQLHNGAGALADLLPVAADDDAAYVKAARDAIGSDWLLRPSSWSLSKGRQDEKGKFAEEPQNRGSRT